MSINDKGEGVCIVGNANIDVLMKSIDRIPEWGTETTVESYEERLGGCAANSALVLASLGMETHMVSTLGNDQRGQELKETLRKAGVNVDGLKTGEKGTGMSLSLNRSDGERLFVTYPGSMFETTCEEVIQYLSNAQNCKFILLTGYFLLSPNIDARKIFKKATELGMITLFDTGWPIHGWDQKTRDDITNLLPFVDYFLPNEIEASAITNEDDPNKALDILAALCRKGIVVKRGGGGSIYKDTDRNVDTKGYKVQVRDTVGAGDSYNAGFIYGLSMGWEIPKCVGLGNAVAATVISRDTGFHVQWNDINELLNN
ncbi:carbohydrate kinase family protein [Paenibacillus wynnii]|uniref:carbohydrate kinase family protein n=1 Tax=Paenibacillus wynnii TaxID=268407 RepID=UPI000A8545D0|nr:carbohydrate kinase family protein [Paenibacillus wynnii]